MEKEAENDMGFYCGNELDYYDGKVLKYSREEEEPQ